jgi:hypothetical protein
MIRQYAVNLMAQIGYPGRRGAKRDAVPSGQRRNEPGEPIGPTEGRIHLRCGGFLVRCSAALALSRRGVASPSKARQCCGAAISFDATTQRNFGQMVSYCLIMLLQTAAHGQGLIAG